MKWDWRRKLCKSLEEERNGNKGISGRKWKARVAISTRYEIYAIERAGKGERRMQRSDEWARRKRGRGGKKASGRRFEQGLWRSLWWDWKGREKGRGCGEWNKETKWRSSRSERRIIARREGGEKRRGERETGWIGREREVETKRIRLEGWKRGKEDGRRGSIRSRWQAASGGTCGRMAPRTGATSCVLDMRKAASAPSSRIHHASSRTWPWIHTTAPTLSHPVIEAREDRCDSCLVAEPRTDANQSLTPHFLATHATNDVHVAPPFSSSKNWLTDWLTDWQTREETSREISSAGDILTVLNPSSRSSFLRKGDQFFGNGILSMRKSYAKGWDKYSSRNEEAGRESIRDLYFVGKKRCWKNRYKYKNRFF